MKLVVDACSMILLAKAGVLEELTGWKEIIVTKGVYDEVIEGKNKQLVDALVLEKLAGENKIMIDGSVHKELTKRLIGDFGLGIGEAESIALALNADMVIVTDNKQGRKTAKIHGLELLGSIDIITVLHKAKKIGKEKAISALKILREHGWFHDYIIEEALREVQNG